MYKETSITIHNSLNESTPIMGRVPTKVRLGKYKGRPIIGFSYSIIDEDLNSVIDTTKWVLNPKLKNK